MLGRVIVLSAEDVRRAVPMSTAIDAVRDGFRELAAASRLTVIGTGAQAPDQVRAVLAVRPITSVTVTGRSADRAASLARTLAAEFPDVRFTPTTDLDASIATPHVICCATSSSTP